MPAEAQASLLLARTPSTASCPLVVPSPLLFVPNPLERFPHQQGTDYAHLTTLAGDDRLRLLRRARADAGHEHRPTGARRSGSASRSRRSPSTWTPPPTSSRCRSASTASARRSYVVWIHARSSRRSRSRSRCPTSGRSTRRSAPLHRPAAVQAAQPGRAPARRTTPPRSAARSRRRARALARAAQASNVVTGVAARSTSPATAACCGPPARRRARRRASSTTAHWFVRSVTTTLKRGGAEPELLARSQRPRSWLRSVRWPARRTDG